MLAPRAATRATALPAGRLVLRHADAQFEASRIYDEVVVVHSDGDAFSLSPTAWYVIGQEVGGVATPFIHHERVCMQVFDEKDGDEGVRRIARYVSTEPWSNGLHYFKALDWRSVGQYRVAFFAHGSRRSELEPLNYFVRVSDPGAFWRGVGE